MPDAAGQQDGNSWRKLPESRTFPSEGETWQPLGVPLESQVVQMARSGKTSPIVSARLGEGYLVPVQRRVVPKPDGTTLVEVGIDLARAPIPQRRYHADAADVIQRLDTVILVFAQSKLYGTDLRSMVAVHMSADGVHHFLRTCADFYPRLSSFIAASAAKERLSSFDAEPEQTVSMAANLIAAAHAGRESIVDFYQMSATAIRELQASSRNEIALDAVLRVDVSAALLAAIIERLFDLENDGELPAEIR